MARPDYEPGRIFVRAVFLQVYSSAAGGASALVRICAIVAQPVLRLCQE